MAANPQVPPEGLPRGVRDPGTPLAGHNRRAAGIPGCTKKLRRGPRGRGRAEATTAGAAAAAGAVVPRRGLPSTKGTRSLESSSRPLGAYTRPPSCDGGRGREEGEEARGPDTRPPPAGGGAAEKPMCMARRLYAPPFLQHGGGRGRKGARGVPGGYTHPPLWGGVRP